MEQDTVPACAQHHVHLTGRAGPRLQVDQGLAKGLLGLVAPAVGGDPGLESGPASGTGEPGLPPAIPLHRDLDIDPAEGADVPDDPPVGPQDLDGALLAREGGHHLHHPGIPGPAPGVDLLQQGDLGLEVRGIGGVHRIVELAVGRPWARVRHA